MPTTVAASWPVIHLCMHSLDACGRAHQSMRIGLPKTHLCSHRMTIADVESVPSTNALMTQPSRPGHTGRRVSAPPGCCTSCLLKAGRQAKHAGQQVEAISQRCILGGYNSQLTADTTAHLTARRALSPKMHNTPYELMNETPRKYAASATNRASSPTRAADLLHLLCPASKRTATTPVPEQGPSAAGAAARASPPAAPPPCLRPPASCAAQPARLSPACVSGDAARGPCAAAPAAPAAPRAPLARSRSHCRRQAPAHQEETQPSAHVCLQHLLL